MEAKMFEKINEMCRQTWDEFNINGRSDYYTKLLAKLHGALELMTVATGKNYVIMPEGYIKEVI